jgi:hypothetical protein
LDFKIFLFCTLELFKEGHYIKERTGLKDADALHLYLSSTHYDCTLRIIEEQAFTDDDSKSQALLIVKVNLFTAKQSTDILNVK